MPLDLLIYVRLVQLGLLWKESEAQELRYLYVMVLQQLVLSSSVFGVLIRLQLTYYQSWYYSPNLEYQEHSMLSIYPTDSFSQLYLRLVLWVFAIFLLELFLLRLQILPLLMEHCLCGLCFLLLAWHLFQDSFSESQKICEHHQFTYFKIYTT